MSQLTALAPLQLAILAGAVLAGVASGMMYVFSTGVLQALGQLPETEAVRAMQAINVAVINPWFLGVFMGTGLYVAVLSGLNLAGQAGPTNPWLLGATAVYVVAVVFVTIGGNVPLNDALAELDANALTAGAWQGYAAPWLAWNHVRSLAAAMASGMLMVAALR